MQRHNMQSKDSDMLSTVKFGWKVGLTLIVALSVFGAVVFLRSTNAAAWDSSDSHGDDSEERGHKPVTICHATGSDNNPYVKITVDDDAVDGNGNNSADHNRDGHQDGEDIIPPGSWDLDGRNWNSQGQAIYNNDCKVAEKSPTPTPIPTPTPSPMPSPTPTPTPNPQVQNPPTFPKCSDQTGFGDKAHYTSGLHQIVGNGLLEGQDDVYTLSNGNFLQCFVPIAKDVCIQTNWWRTDQELAGWYSVNGSQWNLGNFHYLAKNLNYNCQPTPTPTPTPSTGGNINEQHQEQTQNNNQTVNVTVNQTVTGQVEGTKSASITKQPETGVSVLAMTTMFGLLPFGLFLARFGKGRKLVVDQISLASLGQTLVSLRSKRNKRA